MKINRYYGMGILIIIMLLLIQLVLVAKLSSETLQERISRILEIKCMNAEVMHHVDSHNGIHNDGILFVELKLKNNILSDISMKNDNWKN